MPFTVVADIGGTTSRWGVLRDGQDPLVLDGLPGFNPVVGEPDVFVRAVRERFDAEKVDVGDLFAYGAGCGTPERTRRMADTLLSIWPAARVDVASDLLGAAHGLLGARSGLVLILGTGMNAGYFDGTVLHQPMPSLGYILGDEGSGADIGKHFLHDALHGRVPDAVMRAIFPEGVDTAAVIERLYRGAGPQAWLASFTGKLALLGNEGYASALLERRFRALAELMARHFGAKKYMDLYATGSVACGCREILADVLSEAGFSLIDVQPSPLPGLLRYRSALAR